MRDITSVFTSEKNKEANQPIRLYEILDYDGGGNNLYFAEYSEDVAFGDVIYLVDATGRYVVDVNAQRIVVNYEAPTTYTRFPITCDRISENTEGEIDTVRLVLANASRVIQGYLHQYDLRGVKVNIKTVWAGELDDELNCITDTYYIDSYQVDLNNASFILSTKYDVLDAGLPYRAYGRNYCSWRFKGSECAYVGAGTYCNKTLAQCRVYANTLRFGGFPSIPMRRMYIR